MVKPYTAEQLISSVRNTAYESDEIDVRGLNDADILLHLNEEMAVRIVPLLLGVEEEYLITARRLPVTTNSRVRIPTRAAYVSADEILFADGSDPKSRVNLARVTKEAVSHHYLDERDVTPGQFYIEGNYIVLLPDTDATFDGDVEVSFAIQPGELVKSGRYVQVSAVDLPNKTVTVSSAIPTVLSSAELVDIHSKFSGAEVKYFDLDMSAATIVGNDITFVENIDGSDFGTDAVAVGDYICIAGEAVLPSLPSALHPVLARAAACALMRGQVDAQAYQIHKADLDEIMKLSLRGINKRVKGAPYVVGPQRSPLGKGTRRRGYGAF